MFAGIYLTMIPMNNMNILFFHNIHTLFVRNNQNLKIDQEGTSKNNEINQIILILFVILKNTNINKKEACVNNLILFNFTILFLDLLYLSVWF